MLEGLLVESLGPEVCPRVFAVGVDSYMMEFLDVAPRNVGLLQEIEDLLVRRVWCKEPLYLPDAGWREKLRGLLSLVAPSWINSVPCLTHGDPTAANALCRGLDESTRLVIGDPVTRRPYIPPFREVDMGKILQSAAGWESVAYGEKPVEWLPPEFWSRDEDRRRALFWCAVHCGRILKREFASAKIRDNVVRWCQHVQKECLSASGL